jgi:hypothetical protein
MLHFGEGTFAPTVKESGAKKDATVIVTGSETGNIVVISNFDVYCTMNDYTCTCSCGCEKPTDGYVCDNCKIGMCRVGMKR